jgi:hypothetical protein
MDYQIIEFDEASGAVIVLYRDTTVRIEIPITDEGVLLVGEALDKHITNHLPLEKYKRLDQIKRGIPNTDKIAALVVPLPGTHIEEKPVETPPPSLASKIGAIVTERDNRLAGTDWTQLEDVIAIKGEAWSKEWREYRQLLRDMTESIDDIDAVSFPIPPSV